VTRREFEPSAPWGVPAGFLSRDVSASVAHERWQIEAYYRLRREIFEREQGLFTDSDVDEHDARATPIVASSHIAGMPDEVVGVVRIYPTENDTWYGGRLGVAHTHRRVGAVGGALIAVAVSTAHAHGCRRFLATVQARNVRYFERYAFRALGELSVRGQPHQLMQADLAAYPPCPKALALARATAARARAA
jgi:putative N-acetyltransferase (TIGR04045 family)